MLRTLAFTLALLLFLPGPGSAEDGPARTGPYIGAGGVIGVDNFESSIGGDVDSNLAKRPSCTDSLTTRCVHTPLASAGVDLNETGGLDAQIGYRVHRFLAIEAQLEWMSLMGFQSEGTITGDGRSRSLDVDIDTLVITGNLKSYFMTGQIQPFALLGAGMMWEEFGVEYDGDNDDEHSKGFAMRFGGGVDYYATDNVVLTLKASYVLTFGPVSDRDYFSGGLLGLTYRF